jgi:hypothetical protein
MNLACRRLHAGAMLIRLAFATLFLAASDITRGPDHPAHRPDEIGAGRLLHVALDLGRIFSLDLVGIGEIADGGRRIEQPEAVGRESRIGRASRIVISYGPYLPVFTSTPADTKRRLRGVPGSKYLRSAWTERTLSSMSIVSTAIGALSFISHVRSNNNGEVSACLSTTARCLEDARNKIT